MRNYISVNAKYYKATEVSKRAKHNDRSAKIDYLLPIENRKFNNIENNFGQFSMGEKFSLLNQKKQQIQKEKGFYKKDDDLIEMVVSLSEEQALNYLNQEGGDDKLFSGFLQLAEDIKMKFGFEPCGISLHLDEGFVTPTGDIKYNIHAHLDFLNFDFKNEKTVLRNMKKQHWRDLQDLAQNSFQKKDLDFIRGEQKLDNSKDHLEKNDYIASKQQREINSNQNTLTNHQNILNNLIEEINPLKLELDNLELEYTKLKQETKDEYTSLNSLKNDVKELRATYSKDSLDYQNLTTQYHDLQEKEKAKREEYRLLDSKSKELKEEISKLEVIKKEKKELLEKTNKYDITINQEVAKILSASKKLLHYDSDLLEQNIIKALKKFSNYDFNLEQNKKLERDNLLINSETKKLLDRFTNLENDYSRLTEVLQDTSDKLQETRKNSIPKEAINRLLKANNMPDFDDLNELDRQRINQASKTHNRDR